MFSVNEEILNLPVNTVELKVGFNDIDKTRYYVVIDCSILEYADVQNWTNQNLSLFYKNQSIEIMMKEICDEFKESVTK